MPPGCEHLRSHVRADIESDDGKRFFDLLLTKRDIAQHVFSAPRALGGGNGRVELAQIFATLPAELYTAAACGCLGGVSAHHWVLKSESDSDCHVAARLAQLLVQQHHVTALTVKCALRARQVLHAMPDIARATRLTALTLGAAHQHTDRWAALQHLASLNGLQHLAITDDIAKDASGGDELSALRHFSKLASVSLQELGHFRHCGPPQLLRALPCLLHVARLALPELALGESARAAFVQALPTMTALRALTLDRSYSLLEDEDDVLLSGIAACTGLTELSLKDCKVEAFEAARTLSDMRSPLQRLALGRNPLGAAGVAQILKA